MHCLFQYPKKNSTAEDAVWYEARPLGIHSLAKMMKLISVEARLSKVYTNHCVRATVITLWSNSGIKSMSFQTKQVAAKSLFGDCSIQNVQIVSSTVLPPKFSPFLNDIKGRFSTSSDTLLMIEQLYRLFIDTKLRRSFFHEFQETSLHLPSIDFNECSRAASCAIPSFRALVLSGHVRQHEHFWFNKRELFCYNVSMLCYKTNGKHHSVHY